MTSRLYVTHSTLLPTLPEKALYVTHFPNITGLLTNAPAVPMLAGLQARRRKAAAMGISEVIAVGLGKLVRQTA